MVRLVCPVQERNRFKGNEGGQQTETSKILRFRPNKKHNCQTWCNGMFYKKASKTLEKKLGQQYTILKLVKRKFLSFTRSKRIEIVALLISILSLVWNRLATNTTWKTRGLSLRWLKDSWSLHSVKRCWRQPTVLKANDWLSNKADAHGFFLCMSEQIRTLKDFNSGLLRRATEVFAFASKHEKPFYASRLLCKSKHSLWCCAVF